MSKQRKPSEHFLQFFVWEHLPIHLRGPSKTLARAAGQMIDELPEGPEKTAGLRKLLEAKDCFVRAVIDNPGGE